MMLGWLLKKFYEKPLDKLLILCYTVFVKRKENLKNQKGKAMKQSTLTVILSIALIVIALIACYANYSAGKEIYNNGVCKECGGHYHIVGTPTYRHPFYVYECDQCGDSFQTVGLMTKK